MYNTHTKFKYHCKNISQVARNYGPVIGFLLCGLYDESV